MIPDRETLEIAFSDIAKVAAQAGLEVVLEYAGVDQYQQVTLEMKARDAEHESWLPLGARFDHRLVRLPIKPAENPFASMPDPNMAAVYGALHDHVTGAPGPDEVEKSIQEYNKNIELIAGQIAHRYRTVTRDVDLQAKLQSFRQEERDGLARLAESHFLDHPAFDYRGLISAGFASIEHLPLPTLVITYNGRLAADLLKREGC